MIKLKTKIAIAQKFISLYKKAIEQNEFYDLYALEIILSFADVLQLSTSERKNLSSIFDKLTVSVAVDYAKNIKEALIDEAKNIDGANLSQDDLNRLKNGGIEYDKNVKNLHKLTPEQFAVIFGLDMWPSGWGGKAWASIAFMYGKLIQAIKSNNAKNIFVILDQVHQLEHNTGSIFSKFIDSKGSKTHAWMADALNDKAISSSISIIKDKVSPYIKSYLERIPGVQDKIDQQQYKYELGEVEYNRFLEKAKRVGPGMFDFTSKKAAANVADYLFLRNDMNLMFGFITDYVSDYSYSHRRIFANALYRYNLIDEYSKYLEKRFGSNSADDYYKQSILNFIHSSYQD